MSLRNANNDAEVGNSGTEQVAMNRAGCTIISLNYLAYARTLCESFLRFHPDSKFYVLVVDRVPLDVDLTAEKFDIVLVEDLGIPDFSSVAFKYDILELNTNVKPTFLKRLLSFGIEEIVYLDPDICIYNSLEPIFTELETHSLALTPHTLSPYPDHGRSELILLSSGIFNLGFIAVKKCVQSDSFLEWWEDRCLHLAFNEQRSGLFVDQKWANLAPCFFSAVAILRNEGCNMAYWNLHERSLSRMEMKWRVNTDTPLVFFHFSGIAVDGGDRISKYSEAFDLKSRPDLREIFEDYRARLIANGIRQSWAGKYAFASFDNGQYISRLARSVYASSLGAYSNENPFNHTSRFYSEAKRAGLLSDGDSSNSYTSKNYEKSDRRLRILHAMCRIALRMMGADRYTLLMKYLSYISILRNQKDVLRF